MAATVPALVLRIPKDDPLTSAEGDRNLTIIRDFCNALSQLISLSLNPDGTIKAGSVSTTSIIDEAVTIAKMAFSAGARFAADTGTANAIVVSTTPAPLTLVNGMLLLIKVANANSGAVTIKWDTLVAKALLKNGTVAMASGDLVASQMILVAYEAVTDKFHLVNTIPQISNPWNTGVVGQQAGSMGTVLTNTFQEIATVALTLPAGKRWVWVKVVFSGVVPSSSPVSGIEFESNPIRNNGTGLSFYHNAPPSGFTTESSDDKAVFTLIAEGPMTGLETSTPLDLEIRARFPSTAGAGDTPAKRSLYAIGYYA